MCLCEMVGLTLYGYCQGAFGRDSYGSKRIEALGRDWLVVRDSSGLVRFADFEDVDQLKRFVQLNSKESEDEWDD